MIGQQGTHDVLRNVSLILGLPDDAPPTQAEVAVPPRDAARLREQAAREWQRSMSGRPHTARSTSFGSARREQNTLTLEMAECAVAEAINTNISSAASTPRSSHGPADSSGQEGASRQSVPPLSLGAAALVPSLDVPEASPVHEAVATARSLLDSLGTMAASARTFLEAGRQELSGGSAEPAPPAHGSDATASAESQQTDGLPTGRPAGEEGVLSADPMADSAASLPGSAALMARSAALGDWQPLRTGSAMVTKDLMSVR